MKVILNMIYRISTDDAIPANSLNKGVLATTAATATMTAKSNWFKQHKTTSLLLDNAYLCVSLP